MKKIKQDLDKTLPTHHNTLLDTGIERIVDQYLNGEWSEPLSGVDMILLAQSWLDSDQSD